MAECLDQLRRSILVPDSIPAVSMAGSRASESKTAYPAARITSAASYRRTPARSRPRSGRGLPGLVGDDVHLAFPVGARHG